uniref:Uncharacterized protein n=1 Tax=Rhizophora mucronata TaxID=61149 RepID=A0A2P2IK10_RHIMU
MFPMLSYQNFDNHIIDSLPDHISQS